LFFLRWIRPSPTQKSLMNLFLDPRNPILFTLSSPPPSSKVSFFSFPPFFFLFSFLFFLKKMIMTVIDQTNRKKEKKKEKKRKENKRKEKKRKEKHQPTNQPTKPTRCVSRIRNLSKPSWNGSTDPVLDAPANLRTKRDGRGSQGGNFVSTKCRAEASDWSDPGSLKDPYGY